MQKQRQKYSKKSFRLLSLSNNDNNPIQIQNSLNNNQKKETITIKSTNDNFENNNTKNNEKSLDPTMRSNNNNKMKEISKSFAERYTSEIAPPMKMKEYEAIAIKHKKALLNETKILHEKYSEDRKLAYNMEQTVAGVSGMLDEFVNILQSQSGSIQDINLTSKQATQNVRQTGDQLLLTIERSQSHQRNMVILIICLGILLLILDYISP